ncbi:unnamed protein product, partial [Schistosoma rodhaini]
MEATSGYNRARDILKRLFGQAHVIARETLEDLFNDVKHGCHDAEQLSSLAIRMENCSMILEQMNYTADLNSLVTLERVVRFLPQPMQRQWAELVDRLTEDDREPTFAELTQFVAAKARVAASRFGRLAERPRGGVTTKSCYHSVLRPKNASIASAKCSMCSGDHSVYECRQFLALTTEERLSHVKSKSICFVCLRQGHKANECKVTRCCAIEGCSKRHHSLLHKGSAKNKSEDKLATVDYCGQDRPVNSHVCLGTIPVRLRAGNAEVVGYALLDNGSDVTLITSGCLKLLWLNEEESSVTVQTVSGNKATRITKTPFEVYSLDQSEHVKIEGALIVSQIPGHKPTKSVMSGLVKWQHLNDVPLQFIDSGEVVLLIGCDVPEAHWVLDQRLGGRKNPYAVKTLLGWTVFGPASFSGSKKKVSNCMSKLQTIEDQFRKLYDVEFTDVYSSDKSPSVDDRAAIEIVERGTFFDGGHFVVPIPWKMHPNKITGNYEVAASRLLSLKGRLL